MSVLHCPEQDSSSVVEETPSSEKMESRTHIKAAHHKQQKQEQHYHKTPANIGSPYSHHKRRVKEQVGEQQTAGPVCSIMAHN